MASLFFCEENLDVRQIAACTQQYPQIWGRALFHRDFDSIGGAISFLSAEQFIMSVPQAHVLRQPPNIDWCSPDCLALSHHPSLAQSFALPVSVQSLRLLGGIFPTVLEELLKAAMPDVYED